MPPVARAELVIEQPAAVVFAALADFSTWSQWMPREFRPAWGPQRALATGDWFLSLLGGALPTPLQVVRSTPNSEITWRGGVPGVIVGEHAFYLEDLGGARTHVRSEEPFTGLLTLPSFMHTAIERAGTRGGAKMLEGLARFVQG